jgi:D-3-phosphoglycerate dehydrogenase
VITLPQFSENPMSDWKIIVADRLDGRGLEILSKAAQVDERAGISPEELIKVISEYDALIVRGQTRVNAKVFSAATNLKVVGRAGVGVDNIDLAAANLNNVTVVNSPFATTQAVAEHVLALLFSLARSIPTADETMKSGLWRKKQFMGVEIKDKVLGIIGMGNIGSSLAQMSKSLGMQVIGYDPLISNADIERRGASPVNIQELYVQSDFISIHVPLNPETRGMINGGSFGTMKRGVRLICTARGGIVDETALLAALESGQVAGAALDVFAKEPPGMSALVSHPKVVATPHIGAQTAEAQARAAVDIAREVLAALQGDPLRSKIV